MNSIYWLVALAVFLIIEILTLGLTTIWFAGGSLVAFFLSLYTENFMIEFIVFLAVSFLLLFFTRPVAAKYFNSQRTKTNYETLIGKEGKVIEKIDNFNMTGQVIVNGQEWTARSIRDEDLIEAGQKVYIRNVSGVKLIVEIEKEDL